MGASKVDSAIRLERLWTRYRQPIKLTLFADMREQLHGEKDQDVFQSICAEHSAVYSREIVNARLEHRTIPLSRLLLLSLFPDSPADRGTRNVYLSARLRLDVIEIVPFTNLTPPAC